MDKEELIALIKERVTVYVHVDDYKKESSNLVTTMMLDGEMIDQISIPLCDVPD